MKNAYLIMAHDDINCLGTLISLIDDADNDIYIHIDKKWRDFSESKIMKKISHSNTTFIKRKSVTWGGSSMIQCEIDLLQEAIKKYHDFYHLISGADLPIKSKTHINNFLEEHKAYQLVSISPADREENTYKVYGDRIKYYYMFQNIAGRNSDPVSRMLRAAEKVSICIQKYLRVDRTKNCDLAWYKGANWFSITHDFALCVLNAWKKHDRSFKNTFCADELLIATLLMNSDHKTQVNPSSMHYADWNRGNPYTFKAEDYDMLLHIHALWARKFSSSVDASIIERIANTINQH